MTSTLREPDTRQRAPARSRRALVWLARITTAAVAIALLSAAAYGFVLKSMPYHTPQFAAPRVRLSAAQAAVVASYPGGVPAVPVLTWRDISNRPGNLVTSPRQFGADLAALHHDGFRSVPLGTLRRLAEGRHVVLPVKPVILTFDAGLSTDWTTVDPILRRYGFHGVVFVDPRDIALKSPSYFLTKEELSAMVASGRWSVGAQIPLPRRVIGRKPGVRGTPEPISTWRARARRDALAASAELEQVTGRPVAAFAWPVLPYLAPAQVAAPGVLDSTLRSVFPVVLARPAGGAAVFVAAGDAGTALPRVDITAADTLRSLAIRLREGIPSPPPAFPGTLPWAPAGSTRCTSSGHVVTVAARSFGLCTVDANGTAWRDYALRFTLDVPGVRSTDPHGPTAVIELRDGRAGQIEVAVGRSEVTVNERVGRKWSVLHRAIVFTGPPVPGQAPPLLGGGKLTATLRISRRLLTVRIGSVSFSQRVSGRIRDGIIGLGLVPAGHVRAISYSGLVLRAYR